MYEIDDYTVSLLHFDSDYTDETGKVWTPVNSPQIVSSPCKFGDGSFYKNGSNSYLQYAGTNYEDFNLGTDDFTIDFWFYSSDNFTTSQHFARPFNMGTTPSGISYVSTPASTTSVCTEFGVGSSLKLNSVPRLWVCYMTSSGWYIFGSDQITVSANTWHHVAFVRKDGVFYFFFDGSLVGKRSGLTINIAEPSSSVNIGLRASTTTELTNTYYDEFRISKGIARWIEDFTPSAPTNLTAVAGDSKVTLSWTAVDGATSYIVKRSTTSGGTYETIASDMTDISYVDTSVTNGTTYYYVVTAVNTYGESDNSNEASATPVDSSEFLLRITMNDSSEREYKVTQTEVDNFMEWINGVGRAGDNCYKFDDVIDDSKEYLIFEKIISFKVLEL